MRANSILVTMMLSMLLMAAFCEESLGEIFRPNTTEALKDAARDAGPGDAIYLANRNWNDLGVVNFDNSGVVIRSETKGMAVIKGESFLRITGHNVTLKHLTFRDCETPGEFFDTERNELRSAGTTVLLSNAVGSKVQDNKFFDCGTDFPIVKVAAISDDARVSNNQFIRSDKISIDTVGSATGVRIERNHFLDISNQADGGEAVVLRGGIAVRVRWNYFQNCDGDDETISVKSDGHTISFNHFLNDNLRGGVTLRKGNGSYVFGNFFVNCKEGVRIFGNNHSVYSNQMSGCKYGVRILGQLHNDHPNASNCIVINNTIADSTNVGLQVGKNDALALPGPDGKNKFYNNIIQQDAGVLVFEDMPGAMARIRFVKNLVHRTGNNSAWGAGEGNPGLERHDPSIQLKSGIWRLTGGSYARHKGQVYGVSKKDIDGQGRGGAFDIGSDEFVPGGTISNFPVTASNTGVRGW